MIVLETIGTISALLGVWLTVKENKWCWVVASIAIVIYIYIFYQSALYGDMGLQVFYLFASAYGWYLWTHAKTKTHEPPVTKIPRKTLMLLVAVSILGTLILGNLLSKTISNVPYWDAGTTAFSLAATWMMAKKYIENWIAWVVIDIVYVGIYIYKDLNVTAVQYAVFVVLAAYGFFAWRKSLRAQAESS